MEAYKHNQSGWIVVKQLLMLFVSCYILFYIFPFPLQDIPVVKTIVAYYLNVIELTTLWIGHHLLGLEALEKIGNTGSGDTTFDYVKIITNLLLATLLSVVLAIFTGKQKRFFKLHHYTIVYARYFLGLTMLLYGFAKIYDGQFVFPDAVQLEKTYGNSSPMNLLWTFMGYSRSYTVFAGTGEIVGGFLLFFRRTTVLGCLVIIPVMLNVVMLNFSYDVPVKLFSSHLLLIALFIIAPYVKKLADFFIFHKSTELSFEKMQFKTRWMRITRLVLKAVFVVALPLFSVIDGIEMTNKFQREGRLEKQQSLEKYPLVNRGFHWINEYPFNK